MLGSYMGNRVANIYDDVTDTINRQMSSYAVVPSWAHSQLSAEDLSAELREKRLGELRVKVRALAAIEEAEFKEKVLGMSEEERSEVRSRGAVRLVQ